MKIREYAKAVGFEVIGKLALMGKYHLHSRMYMDEGKNRYLIDTATGDIRIIAAPTTKAKQSQRHPGGIVPGEKEGHYEN